MNSPRFFWLFICFIVIIGGVFFTLALTGCSDWRGDGLGTITIELSGSISGDVNNRSALPWPPDGDKNILDYIDYVIKVTNDDFYDEFPAKGGDVIKRLVSAGLWKIEVDAYLENYETELTPNGERIHYANGSGSVEVKAGQVTPVTITMTPVPDENDPDKGDPDETEQILNAQTPIITVQPMPATYTLNDEASPLTVTAFVTDGGELTYQWYSKGLNDEDGIEIPEATSDSYVPPTDEISLISYYVVVTNTNINAIEETTATVRSYIVAIDVIALALGGTVKIIGSDLWVNGTLTVDTSAVTGIAGFLHYGWQRIPANGGPVEYLGSNSSHTITEVDIDHTISVEISCSVNGGLLTSAPTAPIENKTGIYNADQLYAIADSLSSLAGNYILANTETIQITKQIGNTSDNIFTGTFDGNGKIIHLAITQDTVTFGNSGGNNQFGLFMRIGNGGTVKNLKLTGSININSTTTNSTNAGAVAGQNEGTIFNVSSSVNINVSIGNNSVRAGGITGVNGQDVADSATITNCYSTGNISGSSDGGISGSITGGIAGSSSGNSSISFSWASGTVTSLSTSSNSSRASGILGNAGNNVSVTNCVALNSQITITQNIQSINRIRFGGADNSPGNFNFAISTMIRDSTGPAWSSAGSESNTNNNGYDFPVGNVPIENNWKITNTAVGPNWSSVWADLEDENNNYDERPWIWGVTQPILWFESSVNNPAP